MAKFQDVLDSRFENSFRTLKETSHDIENDIYMCNSSMRVIDFDNLTEVLNPIKQPSSCDTIWSDEDLKNIYCIEFKNQDKSGVKNKKVQKKAKDGKITIDEICLKFDIDLTQYKIIFCVVYKSNPNKQEYRNRYDSASTHFGLEKFEGIYFDKVITNNVDYFTKLFTQKYSCN